MVFESVRSLFSLINFRYWQQGLAERILINIASPRGYRVIVRSRFFPQSSEEILA